MKITIGKCATAAFSVTLSATGILGLLLATSASADDTASPQDHPTYNVSFDGTRIHYLVRGHGPAVVLLHGFTGTGEEWTRTKLFDDLLAHGFEVVLVDLRGNGLSDKPLSQSAYEDDAESKDVVGLIGALHLQSYFLVGYSRGSIIASRLMILDRRVKRAVLGGMGAAFTNREWPRRMQFYRALMGEPVPGYEWVPKTIDELGLDRRVQAFIQYGQPTTTPQELATVKIPVLVISGDKDQDNGSPKELAQLIPHARLVTVPGDHLATKSSQEFATAVVSFLKSQ